MIQELLIALMGHPGDIFQADTFQIIGGFPSLHPAEVAIMNEVALIGKDFAIIDSYLQDEDRVDSDAEQSKRVGTFEYCLKYALDRWLDEYKNVIIELEAEAMQQQHANQTVTVAFIQNRLKRYQYLFQQICSLISDLNQTEDKYSGIRLLNFLHSKMTHCGNPYARELYESLLQSLLKLFTRKLAQLVLYSELQDFSNEFMITKKECLPLHSDWDFYTLDMMQLPYFMNESEANTVLFISKAAYVLKKTKSTQAKEFTEKYKSQLARIVQERHVNTKSLIDCLSSMKESIGCLLFDVVTKNDIISHQLEAFRAIYLTGQGSFIDEFLEQLAKLKIKMDASFVPINVNDLNQTFEKTFETSISDEKWTPIVSNKFRMIDSDQSAKEYSTTDLFGASAYLEYGVTWPLTLVIKNGQIAKYNDLFYFFCTLKKTHRRLAGLNHHILNSKSSFVPNAGFVLCSRELFFLNSLWSYIQMDLVDSQFNELVEMAKNKSETCNSLETLAEKHESALQKLVNGCFLETTASSKKISASIRDIIMIINKTCSLVERSLDEYHRVSVTAEHYESLVKELDVHFRFLFQVFKGIQDSSRTLLGQFLIRFDFNQWFSLEEIDR